MFINNKFQIYLKTKLYLQKLDHTKQTITIMNFKNIGRSIFRRAIKIAAKLIGNTQYPRTHTLYKNDTLPPSIFAFRVTTAAPPQIITKIVPKRESVPSLE